MDIDRGRAKYISRLIITLVMAASVIPGFTSPVLKSGFAYEIPVPLAAASILSASAFLFAILMHINISPKHQLWTETLLYLSACAVSLYYFYQMRDTIEYAWLGIEGNGLTLHTILYLLRNIFIYGQFLLILLLLFVIFVKPRKFMDRFPAILYVITPALPGRKGKRWPVPVKVICILSGLLGGASLAAELYREKYFSNMFMGAIMVTLKNANNAFNPELLRNAVPYILIAVAFTVWVTLAALKPRDSVHTVGGKELTTKSIKPWQFAFIYATAFFALPFTFLCDSTGLVDYAVKRLSTTTIYEDYYAEPDDVVTAPEHKKNLVFIVAESIENTLASVDEGGSQAAGFIPNLVRLAEENTQFSHCEGLGGSCINPVSYSYTAGSTIGMTSGASYTIDCRIPLGVTCLEDILHDAGYVQMSVIGSKRQFANFGKYVGRYDDSVLFDYGMAVDLGYVPEGYTENWGIEDTKIFEWSKDFIDLMYESGRPFSIMIRTSDTHASEGGYICPECRDGIGSGFLTAAECTDRKISAFVDWLRQQPYWEDTVVVIVGDHLIPTRIEGLALGDDYVRSTYNCIINSEKEPANTTNRIFSSADMFPTILSSLGFRIDGDRCGLGTDLYSGTPTLPEQMGADWLDDQLCRYSKWLENASETEVNTDDEFILDLSVSERNGG